MRNKDKRDYILKLYAKQVETIPRIIGTGF